MEQEHVISEETAVTNATTDSLLAIVQNKQLADAGRRQLQAIVDLKSKIIESQVNLTTAEHSQQRTHRRTNAPASKHR